MDVHRRSSELPSSKTSAQRDLTDFRMVDDREETVVDRLSI